MTDNHPRTGCRRFIEGDNAKDITVHVVMRMGCSIVQARTRRSTKQVKRETECADNIGYRPCTNSLGWIRHIKKVTG